MMNNFVVLPVHDVVSGIDSFNSFVTFLFIHFIFHFFRTQHSKYASTADL